jgi:hypothetical protein
MESSNIYLGVELDSVVKREESGAAGVGKIFLMAGVGLKVWLSPCLIYRRSGAVNNRVRVALRVSATTHLVELEAGHPGFKVHLDSSEGYNSPLSRHVGGGEHCCVFVVVVKVGSSNCE